MLYVVTSSTRGLLLITRDKVSANRRFDRAELSMAEDEVIEMADYECIGDDFQRVGRMRKAP